MTTESGNIVNIKTGKTLLPFQVRALLMAQFLESKEGAQSSEQFVYNLESRLMTATATSIVHFVRGFVEDLSRKNQ